MKCLRAWHDQPIDWNGPLPTSRLRSKEGPKWCVVQWERKRVPITLTPTCTQPPGSHPRTLRVSTHGQRAAPFRRGLTSLHGDAVGIFYALTDRAVCYFMPW